MLRRRVTDCLMRPIATSRLTTLPPPGMSWLLLCPLWVEDTCRNQAHALSSRHATERNTVYLFHCQPLDEVRSSPMGSARLVTSFSSQLCWDGPTKPGMTPGPDPPSLRR